MDSVEAVLKKLHKKPSNKSKLYNHYNVEQVNQVHEIDVLFLPHDTMPSSVLDSDGVEGGRRPPYEEIGRASCRERV